MIQTNFFTLSSHLDCLMQALRYIREMSGLLDPVLDPRHPALTFTCL